METEEMSFSSFGLKSALEFFMPHLLKALLPAAKQREIDRVMRVYNDDIARLVKAGISKEEAEAHVHPPTVDHEAVAKQAYNYTEMGVGIRLRGAIAHYEAGNQLECIRHIQLAMDHVCHTIGWNDASEYLNEQNRHLNAVREKAA